MFTFTPNNIFLHKDSKLTGPRGQIAVGLDGRGQWYARDYWANPEIKGHIILEGYSCLDICRWLNGGEYRPAAATPIAMS